MTFNSIFLPIPIHIFCYNETSRCGDFDYAATFTIPENSSNVNSPNNAVSVVLWFARGEGMSGDFQQDLAVSWNAIIM